MNLVTGLLFVHALLAILLIGALTHQTLAVWWPAKAAIGRGIIAGARSVTAARYTNAIIVLYLLTAILGGFFLYPTYRVFVRTFLEQLHRFPTVGFFETKENLVAVGIGLLPIYWWYWKAPAAAEGTRNRALVTLILMLIVWWAFFVGHFINNIRGFGL
jgi:hypothetical protein